MTITAKERALTNTLRMTTEALKAVTAERDALKAQRDHLYKEMHYISGITHGQPLRVAAAAMTAVIEMKGTS